MPQEITYEDQQGCEEKVQPNSPKKKSVEYLWNSLNKFEMFFARICLIIRNKHLLRKH